jgi:thioredoxin reductase (NADPH)
MAQGRFLIQRRDKGVNDVTIESEGLTIGRLPGNELVLNHRAVDETHAGIKDIDGRYWVFNLSSNNGIVVNRTLMERREIQDGDLLQAGPYLLRFALAPDGLIIAVEVGAGWHVEDTAATVTPPPGEPTDISEAQSLSVFWEKRKRESGKITDETVLHPRGKTRLGKALACWAPTLDLRQPWRPAWFVWGGIVTLVFGLSALGAWHSAYSPGDIAKPHELAAVSTHEIAKRAAAGACSACHSPLSSMNSQCLSCHQVDSFAEAISAAHLKAGMTCASCHHEHRGSDPRAGLMNDAVCLDCHTNQAPVKEGHRAGQVLGAPHPLTHGYPVMNGVWKWAGLSTAVWRNEGLPESEARRPPSEQFHAIHRSVHFASAGTGRMDCAQCHGPGNPGNVYQPLALLKACSTCHVSTGAAATSSVGCVSCHPPHGTTLEARAVLSALGGHLEQLAGKVTTERAGIMRTLPAPVPKAQARVGALPMAGWVGVLLVPIVVSFLALSRSSTRLRPSLAAKQAETKSTQGQAKPSGPAYPHPVINAQLCIGCHACVDACPHDVIAIVNGVATPIALDQCMEDTACMAECPVNPKACVVVNTLKKIPPRNVPKRNQKYLTNVPGIYLIGDVSGVPLVKNAINEGATVMQYVAEDLAAEARSGDFTHDVAIIGIGPAGFSAAACANEQGLKYVALEQGRLASTIRNYPAGKYVFFKPDTVNVKGPVPLPGVGGRKEDLIRSWDELAARIQIHEMERCTAVRPIAGGFEVATQDQGGQGKYTARRVILAVGNLGSPLKLGVPGEDISVPLGPEGKPVPKVRYSLSDPDDYVKKRCIVVGAGNSAIEAAVDLTGFRRSGNEFSFTRNNEVALLLRTEFKGDLKLGNKMNIFDCMDSGRIKVYFSTVMKEIREGEVTLADFVTGQEKEVIANDFILALIGAERPTKFLQSCGVEIEGLKPRT